MPYRDFWLIMPPMEVIAPAALYALFGININLLLAINSVFSAAAGAISFVTGRIILARKLSALFFSLLFFFSSALYSYAGYSHSNWFLLFLITAAYYFTRYIKEKNDRLLVISGCMMAVATSFRVYEAAPFYIGAITALAFFSATSKRRRLYEIILFSASAVALWVAIFAIFFHGNYLTAITEIFVNSVRHASASPAQTFGDLRDDIIGMRAHMDSLWLMSYYGNNLMRHTLIYFMIPIAGMGAFFMFREKSAWQKKILMWLLIWMFLSAGKIKETLDGAILGFAVIPAHLILILGAEDFFKKPYSPKAVLLTIFIVIFIGSSFYGVGGEWAARLIKNRHPIYAPTGAIFSDNKEYARETNAVINAIRAVTDVGDYIAILHAMPYPFLAATGTRNATYYDSLIDLQYRPSQEKEKKICDDMLEKKTMIVIIDPRFMKEKSDFEVIKACIRKSFDVGSVYDNYLVYHPREKF
jgi:hypothetical protein